MPNGNGAPPSRDLRGAAAIAGLGITEVGKVYGRTSAQFAADAVLRAVADAGLRVGDIDGLLTSNGMTGGGTFLLADTLGLRDLRLNVTLNAAGATASAAIQYAAMAVATGMCEAVVYVHADAPLAAPGASASGVYAAGSSAPLEGLRGVARANGLNGANPLYALAARRHMERYGTTTEHLGAIAVAQRAWAARSPLATMRDPITLADHQASRWIAEPLRLLDCCLVSNGGIAFVVTSAARARDLAQPPVYIWGWGQGHPGYPMERGSEFGLVSGAVASGGAAMGMAGIKPADVDVCELYDCYTFTVLITLEDYGFCAKGEGGPFAASGALGPGGLLPTNTGGGQLSGYYLWGVTPLSEAVVQARGQGGDRQAPSHDVVLVSGNGGVLDFHGTVVLSPHAS
jgi:acetyl-CoA acetyltransferase